MLYVCSASPPSALPSAVWCSLLMCLLTCVAGCEEVQVALPQVKGVCQPPDLPTFYSIVCIAARTRLDELLVHELAIMVLSLLMC